ncbi:hypothetical protein [Sinorhizobium meliloti]|uniref:hypothetical protein n=1 Tax=Rhizobium meliloti TaxID=382 RepID=UPI000FD8909B|nr:hypothetical protein [Sinorhizobium meliloti]RVH23313.1 hypothetical protein CN215_19980 [Sinorhizobium meliloti]
MRDRDDFALPEQRASTGLPVGIMLLSMLTIGLYLIVGSALVEKERSRSGAVYLPTTPLMAR